MYANCFSAISPEHGLTASLFIGGLVGSATHCTGMCGPLVLGQIGALPEKAGTFTKILLPYHLGRITTYIALAIVFSAVVNFAAFYDFPRTFMSVILLSLAALMFLVTAIPGLSMMFPWLTRITLPVPNQLIRNISRFFMVNPTGWRGYLLGITLGFLPCGLVIAALMAVSTAPTIGAAAIAMAAFGLGTAPALVATAFGGGWIKNKWPIPIKVFSSIIMAANSMILFWLAIQQVA